MSSGLANFNSSDSWSLDSYFVWVLLWLLRFSSFCSAASVSVSQVCSIFIETINCVPLSNPSEWTSIVPWFCATIACTMVRPSPIPSEFRLESDYSILPNRLNSLSIFSFSMPLPESFTLIFSSCSIGLYDGLTSITPFLVNLIAFLIRFISTCYRRTSSPCTLGICLYSLTLITNLVF